MARAHLTELTIRSLKPGVWLDDKLPAFGIRVGKHRRTWFVIRTQKRLRTNLGHWPEMNLSTARDRARALLLQKPEEQKAPVLTFAQARAAYLAEHRGRPSTRKELTRLLTKHFAELDDKQLPSITDTQLHSCMASLKPSEALHAFRAARAMLRWCVRPPRRYVAHSPLEGYAPPSTDGRKTRTLTDAEIRQVLQVNGTAGAITKLMLLWGTRKGETLALRRDWIAADILTIPAEITKNGRPHNIPILPLAQSILDSTKNDGPYFFPGRWDKTTHLNEGSWTKLHRKLLKLSKTSGWSAHDCRRTFRSACARHGVNRDLAERLLNHAQGALDEIYDHHDYISDKRKALALIETWISDLMKTEDALQLQQPSSTITT